MREHSSSESFVAFVSLCINLFWSILCDYFYVRCLVFDELVQPVLSDDTFRRTELLIGFKHGFSLEEHVVSVAF